MFIFVLYTVTKTILTLIREVRPKPNWRKYSLIRKKTARVIFFSDRLAHAKPVILDMNALNVYDINIFIYIYIYI